MSQIDKLTYIPVLFWFVLFFVAFYISIYSFFVPFIFSIMKTRESEYALLSHGAGALSSLVLSLRFFSHPRYLSSRLLALSSSQLIKGLSNAHA